MYIWPKPHLYNLLITPTNTDSNTPTQPMPAKILPKSSVQLHRIIFLSKLHIISTQLKHNIIKWNSHSNSQFQQSDIKACGLYSYLKDWSLLFNTPHKFNGP